MWQREFHKHAMWTLEAGSWRFLRQPPTPSSLPWAAVLAITAQAVRLALVVVVDYLQTEVAVALHKRGADVGQLVRPAPAVRAEHDVLALIVLQPGKLLQPVGTEATALARGGRPARRLDHRLQTRGFGSRAGLGAVVECRRVGGLAPSEVALQSAVTLRAEVSRGRRGGGSGRAGIYSRPIDRLSTEKERIWYLNRQFFLTETWFFHLKKNHVIHLLKNWI